MTSQQSQTFDWNETANHHISALASANGAFVEALAKATQNYVEGINALSKEFSEFLASRLKHDAEYGQSMACCRNWTQLAEAQQAWARQASEEYAAEAQKIAELGMKLAANGSTLFRQESKEQAAKTRK
ncbi:MAG: phasin family protein [Pseudomonadota bacterium]